MSRKFYSKTIVTISVLFLSILLSGCRPGDPSSTDISPSPVTTGTISDNNSDIPDSGQSAPNYTWSESELLLTDFLLYYIDCATTDAHVFPDGAVP